MSQPTTTTRPKGRATHQQPPAATVRRRRRQAVAIWIAAAVGLVAIVAAMMWSSKPSAPDPTGAAPGFTLTDTSGEVHRLSDHLGENVLIYFSEGSGCQSCTVQMRELERRSEALEDMNVTVLPIVMNSREQILPDMQRDGVQTPFLLDDGTVSKKYDTLGKGMHAGLPGHGFILVDTEGNQLWRGEYPSMWVDPDELLDVVQDRLGA